MSTLIRSLNDDGARLFREYLGSARSGSTEQPPLHILVDGRFSDPLEVDIPIDGATFSNAFELGTLLVNVLSALEARDLSRNYGVWSWLALYLFDQLAPGGPDGKRKVLEDAVYILDSKFVFNRYYRHAVRTPWQAVRIHGEFAKVLLLGAGRGTRTDIAEQIGAYQDLFGSKNVIAVAYKLWFDPVAQRPRRGAGSKGAGSPRRLSTVIRQLQLTFDLADCPLSSFLDLLPREFDKWKADSSAQM